MQLVGREIEIEIDAIGAVLDDARGGGRPVVVVRGEAGILGEFEGSSPGNSEGLP